MTGAGTRAAAVGMRMRSFMRLRPFDTRTAEGRANERHRRVTLSALASVLAKMISVVTALVTVPLTLNYLGAERYGLWMTLSSLLVMLAFADLGIGNGLLNVVANAHGRDDPAAIRQGVSSGYFALGGLAMLLLAVFAACYPFVPWPALFNVKTAEAASEVGPAVAVFFVCFALAVPLAVVQRVQMGLQRSFLASLWQCAASLLGLAGIIVAVRYQAGLPWLVAAFFGAPLVAALANTAHFFGYMHPEIAPRRGDVRRAMASILVRGGSLFLVLQLVAGLSFASDAFVIAHVINPAAVATYAVPEKMFSLVTASLAMVLAPLWPAYGEALARGDTLWAKRTLWRSMATAVVVSALAAGLLVLAGPTLLELWVGRSITAPMSLLVGLALWKTIEAGGTALAAFLNGANIIKAQVIVASITAGGALALKVLLVRELGVAGAVWATILAYTALTAVPLALLLPRILRRLPAGQPAV